MPDKTLTYIQLAQDTARQITSNYRSWTAYLSTASRLYKYQYSDQLLIHAQRPDATACAEYDLWNSTMHRYVRRGSKGIALLHNNAGQLSLRYVFDVSDTGTRRTSLDPFLWQINERNEPAIAAMLEQEYDVSAVHGLHFQLAEIAQRQASAYWQDHQQDVFRIVDGSFLEEYDEINVRESFRRATSISVCYTLQARCGLDVDSQFEHEDFLNVFDWNTPDAVAVLGTAVSQISGQVLRQIETIAKRVERSVENDRDAVHDERRLPVSEPDRAESAQPALEQVRTDEGEVPGGTEADPVSDDAAERDADQPSAGDQRDGEPSPGADDAGAGESSERDGKNEGQRPDGLDAADEQPKSTGRGDPADGADLQLSFLDGSMAIPTEAEQIHSIEEAERAIFAPFAFSLPQEDIDHILRTGSNTSNHRMILVAEFSKQKPLEEMTAMLRRVYHGGNGIATEHGRVAAWYAEDGIHLATGGTARYTRTAQVLSWTDAAKRIGELLDAGHFATNIEVAAAAGHERHRMAEAMVNLYWDTSAEAREQGYMATLGGMCSGSHPASVEAATNALADPAMMPAMLAEYKDFRAACKETPGLMRFRYHFIDELDVLVNEYTMPRREFSSTMPEIPKVLPFITDDELAEAISHGSSFTSGKASIYEFFIQPHTPKEYADFLKKEYGIGGHSHAISGATYSDESYDGKGLHYKKRDCPDIHLSWPQAVKRIQDLIRLDRYLTPQQKAELEAIREMHDVLTEIPDERILEVRDPDEINVEYARARLEEAGIVNGEVVDPEKLANAPIVRAVEAIAAEMEQEADEPAALTDVEYAQQYLTPEETVFEIDGHTYMVDRVNLEAGTVNIQDITFSNAPASPIFRVEPISFVRKAIEEADAANPLLDPTRYQLMEIAGQEAIFSNGRFDRDKLPDFLHCYDIREDSYGNPARLEPSVVVNHFGSILTKKPIEFPPEGYIDLIADDDWTFGEEQLTVADFIRRPEPREYTAEVEAVYPAEQNGTAFDVVVEKLRFDPPAQEKPVPVAEEAQPVATETAYRAGDILYLDNRPFVVESVGVYDVHMRDPEAVYPIMRAESKGRLERLLALDKRNAAFLPRDNAALEPVPVPQIIPENYRITNDRLGEGGPKEKFKRNVEAIRVLKALEADNRPASPAEQEILAQYVGWGGLADAFDEHKAAWAVECAQLRNLLTPEEYNAAMGSVLNAHYTSPTIIRAIYDAVERMGFTSGNVLEPAMGVGNFFGMMPESMSDGRLYGVELDSISGRIAKQLYPKANITVAGFETTDRRDFFDLAVGNVPFGNYKVDDKAYNRLGFSIHNYFIAKMIDQVRPGGVVAVVTSRYTMDQQSPEVRKYLAERAELLGAIRLPNDAFRANAGTDVVADILFFQKRERAMTIEPDWVHLGENSDGFAINQYFIDHPEMVLGEQTSESTQYGQPGYTVSPTAGATLADELRDAVQRIHGTYVAAALPELAEGEEIRESIPADPSVKNYSYTIVDGQVYYRENSIMVRPDLNQTAQERVKGLVGLRDCVHALIDAQMDEAGDSAIQGLQAELNQRYDAFTAKYGLINARGNALAFSDDSSYYLLCSLEVLDDQQQLKRKADMFTKRTIKQQKVIEHVDTAVEALTVSIAERVGVDLPFMAQLTGKPEDELAEELTGVIFPLPESVGAGQPLQYVTANEYLSGNVRQKFRDARLMAERDTRFVPNVEALAAAQPKDLDASEIDIRLGATWVHKDYIQQFMYETFNTPYHLKRHIQVHFSPYTAEWNITGRTAISSTNVAAYTTSARTEPMPTASWRTP